MSDSTPLKRCGKCKSHKPLSEFYRNKSKPDGYQDNCKLCRKESTRRYRAANPDKARESRARYRRKYPEKIAQYKKEYRSKHPECDANYRQKHREQIREYARQQYRNNYEYYAEYRRKNRERIAEYHKKWHAKRYGENADYREKLRLRSTEYYHKNKERILDRMKGRSIKSECTPEYRRKNYLNNRDQYYIRRDRRRARKINAEGTHTRQDKRDQFTRQRGICYYCDCKLINPFQPAPKMTKKAKAHWEHVIPLVRGGRNDLSNLVWTCAKCNLSKGSKLLGIEWKAPNGRLI